MNRIYCEKQLNPNTSVELSPNASHHLSRVLRMRVGDEVILFDGSGLEYHATLIQFGKKTVTAQVNVVNPAQRESPLFIELGQAVSRGDRMDYAIQKAVELGVSVITPLLTARCNVQVSEKRMTHWQNIIIAASEQSGRLIVPKLNNPLPLIQWLSLERTGLCLVCNPEKKSAQLDEFFPKRVTLLVGSEGGLTNQEVASALDVSYRSLNLGSRVLRTETAAVVALTFVQVKWGDI